MKEFKNEFEFYYVVFTAKIETLKYILLLFITASNVFNNIMRFILLINYKK